MCLVTAWLLSALLLDRYGRRGRGDRHLNDGGWDAIVVAGCAVMPDGSPSRALRRRTERAVELWRQGIAPVIVLTGGRGGDRPAEARAAASYARERLGVPATALLIEDRSSTTEENARFTRDVLDAAAVVVVSDAYHIFRCERVFSRYFRRVGSTSAAASPRVVGALREVGAVMLYALARQL